MASVLSVAALNVRTSPLRQRARAAELGRSSGRSAWHSDFPRSRGRLAQRAPPGVPRGPTSSGAGPSNGPDFSGVSRETRPARSPAAPQPGSTPESEFPVSRHAGAYPRPVARSPSGRASTCAGVTLRAQRLEGTSHLGRARQRELWTVRGAERHVLPVRPAVRSDDIGAGSRSATRALRLPDTSSFL